MLGNYLVIGSRNLIKNRIGSFKYFLMLLVLAGSLTDRAGAQDTILTVNFKGRLDSLYSPILKQERLIQVFVPTGYKAGSTDKYDVLYVLDGGNWNTGLITQIQNFTEKQGYMPPVIIVSVLGIDRNIDLTPTHLESWQAASGGAGKFLAFIKDELIPHIDSTYPSNGVNTLWGHSLGGLFVVYALLNEPTSFKSYIAVDPSLWWDNCYVPKMASVKMPALPASGITLFISGREGPELHEMRIDTMDLILKRLALTNMKWKLHAYSDESHSSVRFKSTYDGLKFTYAGYSHGIEFHPMHGIVLNDKPIKIWYSDDTTRVYYTLDGTVPTESSPKVQRQLTLNSSARVTYKRISNRNIYDQTVTGNFTSEKVPPPVSKPGYSKPGGFSYAYYEGDSDKWPDLKSLTPVKTGIINKDFKPSDLPRNHNYALDINGYFEAKEDGYYTFYLRAGKGAKVYMGGKLIIEWTDNFIGEACSYILPLSKGYYPIRIEYFYKKEDYNLLFYYVTPGTMAANDAVPVPPDVEYSAGKK